MAFILEKFSPAGSNSDKGVVPQQFSYISTTDTIKDMKVAGYFNDAAFQLFANDMISFISSDGMGIFHVVSSAVVVGSGTVVVDKNIISNGGADNSATFHNIYDLSDFPVQDETTITLENGVNYQVYMEGPVSSDLVFKLAEPYDKGGSLMYMGALGVLQWNHTNGSALNVFITGLNLVATSHFKLSGFSFIDVANGAQVGVVIAGTTDAVRFGSVVLDNCNFEGFPAALFFEQGDLLVVKNTSTVIGTATSNVSCVETHHCLNVQILNCDFEANTGFPALDLDLEDMEYTLLDGSIFRSGGTSVGTVILNPDLGVLVGPIVISGCSAFSGASITPGLRVENRHTIASITNSGGKALITTTQDHSVLATDKINIWATSAYDGINVEVTAVTSNTMTLVTDFTSINYAGNLSMTSLDQASSKFISISNSPGFVELRPAMLIRIRATTTQQFVTTPANFQKLSFNPGVTTQGEECIATDFKMFNNTNNIIQYTGLYPKQIKATVTFNTVYKTFANKYEMRLSRESSLDVIVISGKGYEFSRSQTTNTLVGYSFETYFMVDPGDLIVPEIKQHIGTDYVIISDMSFSVST